MGPVSAISLSGLQAAQTALGTSAHNVANAQTPGFRRQQVASSSLPDGGVSATPMPAGSGEGASLETDMVQQLVAKNQFLANLAVFRSSDRMAGALIDAVAR